MKKEWTVERRPRRIAPRLASGDSRVPFGHGLPEAVKNGLREIAALENESMSWVLEKIIIEYFGFDQPEYKKGKINGKKV